MSARTRRVGCWHTDGGAGADLSRLVAVVALVALAQVWAVELAHAQLADDADGQAVRLATDDGGAPMFTATNLTPNQTLHGCIAVSHDGMVHPGELALAASAGGTLMRYLDLTIESGLGGRYGDCDGFVGEPHYAGTLEAFARTYGEGSAGLAVPTASATVTSFRLTVRVRPDAGAAGTSGNASFVWRATDATVSTPLLPRPENGDTSPVGDEPGAAEATNGNDPGSAAAVDRPASRDTASPPSPPAVPVDPDAAQDDPGRRSSSPSVAAPREEATVPSPSYRDDASPGVGIAANPGAWRDRLHGLLDAFAAVYAVLVESATFPLLLLLLVIVFLLIQDRIDRKDPKLAAAPVGPEPDLEFRRRWPVPGGVR